MASKESELTSCSQKRSFEAVEIVPEFPTWRKKKRALRATQKFNAKEKTFVKEEKGNPHEVDRLNNDKNINPGVKAEPRRKEYFVSKSKKAAVESSSENTKSAKQDLEILESKLEPLEGKLLVKEEISKREIPLSHSDVKMEPVGSENNSEIMNPVVKAELITDEYQIKSEKCLKTDVKLESNGIDVKIEPVDIKDCFEQTDIDDRKLFVGGLPTYAKESDIQDYFEKFGKIEEIILKMDPVSGRSRGFAFVTFKTVDGFVKALVIKVHVLMGKNITIKKAESKQGKIYVGKIPDEISSEDIKYHFSKFGTITLFEQPVDKVDKKGKDFCFITFKKEILAKQLIKIGITTINGVQINVKKVTPNQKTDVVGVNLAGPMPFFGPRLCFGPRPFLGPGSYFGPAPFFGCWQNFGPRPFAPMGNFASQPWPNY